MTEYKKQAGKKGGLARRDALSPVQLKAQAQRAAAARWGKPLIASHKGSFAKDFGLDVECYVLDDATHTPVISQTGMARAIGLVGRGNALPRFLTSQAMAETVGAELREKLANPLKFQWGSGGAQQPPGDVHGYDATLLIDLCRAIVEADVEGKLKPQQKKLATNAAVVISASAKQGIRDLVYALAGYDSTRQEVIEAFKLYVREEAREYEREFPEQLYNEWYRLYKLPKPERNKPWKFKWLTIDHVYYPVAKSQGKVYKLVQSQRAASGEGTKKLHQFLSDIGVKALRTQLGQTLGIAQVSESQEEYERNIRKVFGDQPDLFDQ